MNYGEILKRSWEITWKNRGLWILGVLASCSRGGGGGGGGGGSGGGTGYETGQLPPGIQRSLEGIERFFEESPEMVWAIVILSLCVVFFLVILAWVLAALGESGLIAGFSHAEERGSVTLGEAFRLGLASFWKVLGIQLIIGVAGLALAAILVLVAVGTMGLALACFIPILCLLVPIFILLGSYIELAQVAAVVDQVGILDAFGRAWKTIRDHPGPVIIMTLILVFGGGLVAAILALPYILIIGPAVIGAVIGGEGSLWTGIGTSLICLVLAFPFLIALNGILQTYIVGAWTLTYRRLSGRPGNGSAPLEPVPSPI